MNEFRVLSKILLPIIAIALVGAACSHKQVRQLIAGGPAPGSGPEFVDESVQPMPEVPVPIARSQPRNSELAGPNTKGLDVVLIIPRSGKSLVAVDEIKSKLTQLVESIHRLVPIARVGIVAYSANPETVATVPLTDQAPRVFNSIAAIKAQRSTSEEDDIRGAARAAVGMMRRDPNTRCVIVLVVDRAIETREAAGLVEIVRKFRNTAGVFNVVDALPDSESAARYDKSPHEILRTIAVSGGGEVKPLRKEKAAPKRPANRVSPRADIA